MTDTDKTIEKIDAENKKLAEQIAANEKKKESILAANSKKVIEDIKTLIAQYGFTPEQLFGVIKASKPKAKKPKAKKPVIFLYQNEKGEGWTGGRGAIPKWVKDIKDAGGDIEKYRIKK